MIRRTASGTRYRMDRPSLTRDRTSDEEMSTRVTARDMNVRPLPEPRSTGERSIRIHPSPTYRYQCSQFGDSFRLLPFVELRQLVRAQEEKELSIGIAGPNVAERVHRVRRPPPVQLHLAHLEERVIGHGGPSHFRSEEGR